MSYENLLDELEKLNKSMPAATEEGAGKKNDDGKTDDAAIAAAAAAGGEGGGGADAGTADDGKTDDGATKELTEMAKALGLKAVKVMIDGKEVEALEGDQLLKGLLLGQKKLGDTQTEGDKVLKSLAALTIRQAKSIESLAGEVSQMRKSMETIADGGRGRRSAVVVMPPNEQRQEDKGMKPGEFMAKALSAQRAGRITGSDIAEAEACINRGINVPDSLVHKVLAA